MIAHSKSEIFEYVSPLQLNSPALTTLHQQKNKSFYINKIRKIRIQGVAQARVNNDN